MNLGFPELIVIFAVALLVFGPRRLPELAKGMGKGIRDFKKALSGEDELPKDIAGTSASHNPAVPPGAPLETLRAEPTHAKEPA